MWDLQRYESDGFLVVHDAVSARTCDDLRARAAELVDGFDPGSQRSVFSSAAQRTSVDDYFLASANTIGFFYEPGALGPHGEPCVPKAQAINKMGHALHDLDPVFDAFSRTDQLANLCRQLGMVRPLLMQSMYIFKQPGIGGEVRCHQDATFLYTQPQNMLGLWFALEDATVQNGCLWAIPGAHQEGLKSRFLYDAATHTTRFSVADESPWPMDRLVALEVPKGTMILLHGLCPHLSYVNTSRRSRHAYTLHITDGTSDYPQDNWLRRAPQFPPWGFVSNPHGRSLHAL